MYGILLCCGWFILLFSYIWYFFHSAHIIRSNLIAILHLTHKDSAKKERKNCSKKEEFDSDCQLIQVG